MDCSWWRAEEACRQDSRDFLPAELPHGTPLAEDPLVRQRLAQLAIEVDVAWCLANGIEASKEIAMAKAWTSDACRRVCAAAHQIHGGIDCTKEYGLQLYFRRAKQGEVMYGDADLHREVVAQAIGL